MRNSCLNCARKHLALAYVLTLREKFPSSSLLTYLGQAEILFDEFMTGDYEAHFWLAIGHLARMENYFYGNPKTKNAIFMADLIRKERIKSIENQTYRPDFFMIYQELKRLWKNSLLIPEGGNERIILGNIMEAIEETAEAFPSFAKKMFQEYSQVINKKKSLENVNFINLIELATSLEKE